MRSYIPSGIRARLLALVFLLGIVPSVVMLIHTGMEHREAGLDHIRADAVQLAALAASSQTRVILGAEQVLVTLARLPEVRAGLDGECDSLFAEILRDNPTCLNLGVTDSAGEFLSSAVPHGPGINASDRSWYIRARRTHAFAVGDYQIGRITGKPSVNVCLPVTGEDGRTYRYIFAALSLASLRQFPSEARIPPGGSLLAVDRNGTVLVRWPDPEGWVGRNARSAPLVLEMLAGRRGTFEAKGVQGIKRVWAVAPLMGGRDAVGFVAVGFGLDGVIGDIGREMARDLGLIGIVCILVLLVGWWSGNAFIVRPVMAMVRVTRKIRDGDLDARIGSTSGRGELAQLEQAIDEMADALKNRRDEATRGYVETWEATERFRLFMDNSPAVAFMKDANRRYVYINGPFERLFKVSLADLRDSTYPPWMSESQATQVVEDDKRVLESDQAHELTEIIPARDGKLHTWFVVKFPIRDATGRRFLGAVALDMTKHRELEEQLLQAQKMEAVGRLAGGVAHDFNNVLTAIMGYAQLMTTRLKPDDPASHDAEEILKASTRAALLTRQLLTFSRREVVQLQILDMNTVVTDIAKMLRRLIGADVQLILVPAAGRVSVKADPGQLEQVIMNLAVNARDAMPLGGRLTIETSLVELNDEMVGEGIAGLAPGPRVLLAVTDTGVGMDRETQARIFEPFFTTKAADKGTGLGLSTVFGIVERCGASIQVISDIGLGTTFKIYFPPAEGEAEGSRPAASRPEIPHGTETILIVEDQDAVAAVMRAALEGCGYTILEARNAPDALTLCENHEGPIDLLLADMILSGMMGPELAERIAAMRPEARVMFTSGYTERGLESFGTLDRRTPYLPKPFGPEQLARKVREVLDSRQNVMEGSASPPEEPAASPRPS